ncbi:hypothetical protein [Burkholderia ubonensis]|uniref:hypothetical protein n=1 Tax=Burkholderia ubonensis TaxID=101571 RepID=UPI001160D2A8|nr:hypothetical protein [Burkholderia ubonensis]
MMNSIATRAWRSIAMRVPVRLAAGARRSDNGIRPCVLHGGTPLSGCVPVSDGGRVLRVPRIGAIADVFRPFSNIRASL